MVPHLPSVHDSAWCSYERIGGGLELNQPKDDDVDIDNSPGLDNYSESLASSSSFLLSSTDRSKRLISASSSGSNVSCCNEPEHTSWNPKQQELPAILQSTSSTLSHQYGSIYDCVDPQLVGSDSISTQSWRTVENRGWAGTEPVSYGEAAVRKHRNDTPTPAPQNTRRQTRNEFDIAFDEMQVTSPSSKSGAQKWLRTWVDTNPDRFPEKVELESIKTLSGLSISEIIAWLSQHVSIRLDLETEPTFSRLEDTPRPTCAPRYRPKCRRSRRRFRYIAEAQDETRIYECTHRCGQSFTKKGQWTRHERYNVEEWRCHLCKFVSARKDKLLKHSREAHNLRSSTKKSHCRQLLEPGLRPCGFCLKEFDDWSAWLNHVSAHFEGHIAGGPWNMTRWNEALDQELGSNESDDDDNNDDDGDDDHNGNDEDQTDQDGNSPAADQAGGPSSNGKGNSYGHGPQGSFRSSGTSKSTLSRVGPSNSCQRASGESFYRERGSSTAKSVNASGMSTETRLSTTSMPSHTMPAQSPTVSRSRNSLEETREALDLEFTTLQRPSEAPVDILAAHNFSSPLYQPWNLSGGRIDWLGDQVPSKVPNRRNMAFGYDAKTSRSRLAFPSSVNLQVLKNHYVNEFGGTFAMHFLLDTGADVSLLSKNFLEKFPGHLHQLHSSNERSESDYPVMEIPSFHERAYLTLPFHSNGLAYSSPSASDIIDDVKVGRWSDQEICCSLNIVTTIFQREVVVTDIPGVDGAIWSADAASPSAPLMVPNHKKRSLTESERQDAQMIRQRGACLRYCHKEAKCGPVTRSSVSPPHARKSEERFDNRKIWEAAQATSAAPSFSSMADPNVVRFGNHGVQDSNPIEPTLVEALLQQWPLDFALSYRCHNMTDPDLTSRYRIYDTLFPPQSQRLTPSNPPKVLKEPRFDARRREDSGAQRKTWNPTFTQISLGDLPEDRILVPSTGFATIRPRAASLDTIRRLYGGRNRTSFTHFKMERFLNEPDYDLFRECAVDESIESGALCPSLEDNPEMFGDEDREQQSQENSQTGDDGSYKEAGFASPVEISGASRRGQKKGCEEKPDDWPK